MGCGLSSSAGRQQYPSPEQIIIRYYAPHIVSEAEEAETARRHGSHLSHIPPVQITPVMWERWQSFLEIPRRVRHSIADGEE